MNKIEIGTNDPRCASQGTGGHWLPTDSDGAAEVAPAAVKSP